MDPIHESANCLADPSPGWTVELPVATEGSKGRISIPWSFFLEVVVPVALASVAIARLELNVAAGAPRLRPDLWP